METFKWCIRPNYSIDNEPDISEISFGDGYTQRRLNGINSLLNTYSVSIKVKNKSAVEIQRFFEKHKGIMPFYFVEPLTKQRKKVICKKWPMKVGQTYTEFTCDFNEEP
ncbi:phage tail protein [Rodentibacter pneumotropicus]|uniref:phage tail protein n=1 Tax=Rodentibacter pneumotropicus TaxID=758 RepID=UPI0009891DEA|nr:phage tail protein [Rodentibacter pneumotropicus]THA00308.1 phage tail protein [Rodentibacter pneumotropicus]